MGNIYKTTQPVNRRAESRVPRAGLEPARTKCPQDFKSGVSTDSTTAAFQ